MNYKNRKRIKRGLLTDFTELPSEIQSKFIEVKSFLQENGYLGDVYVFGSFLWGWWDEHSDLDIIVDNIDFPYEHFKVLLKEKYNTDLVIDGQYITVRTMGKNPKQIKVP